MVSSKIHDLKMTPEQVEKFQAFFMEKSGLVFEGRRIQEMERAVARRMIELGQTSFDEYLDHIGLPKKGKDELNQLVVSLTVGETQFYRTPEQFAALRKYVFPEWIDKERRAGKELRILSAGCATGEEPYTLSILLRELLPDFDSWKIKIVACDINTEFLEAAHEGVYGKRKMKLVDPVTLDKYFDKIGKYNWRIKDLLRENIEWAHFNLNSEALETLGSQEPFHLALCRNVLIYFKLRNIRQIIDRFHKILMPGGYLMLGYSETLFKISDRFQSVHTPEAFFYLKTENPTPAVRRLPERPVPFQRDEFLEVLGSRPHPRIETLPAKPGSRPLIEVGRAAGCEPKVEAPKLKEQKVFPPKPARERPEVLTKVESEDQLWEQALEFFSEEKFDQAKEKFEQMAKQNPCSARAHLGLGFLYANLGAEDRSREHAEEARRHDDLLPEIYFLLALLDEKNSEFDQAIANYQRVILLSPDFAMAHFNLGNLYYKLNRHRDARREFTNTISILTGDGQNKSLRFSGGLSRDAVIDFCEMQRDQIVKAVTAGNAAGNIRGR